MRSPLLAMLLLLGALISVYRLFAYRASSISLQADAAHILMNTSMAVMFSQWYGADAKIAVLWVYALTALAFAIFLTLQLRAGGEDRDAKLGAYGYHLVVSGAMFYVAWRMGTFSIASPNMAMPEPTVAWPLFVIGLVFALDAFVTAVVTIFFPRFAGTLTPLGATEGIRIGAVPHVIMDIGMVSMIFGS